MKTSFLSKAGFIYLEKRVKRLGYFWNCYYVWNFNTIGYHPVWHSSLILLVLECPWLHGRELEVHLLWRIAASSYGHTFLDIMNVHWIEAFLPSDVCKVMKNPSLSILKSASCLWGWLSSPTPTQELGIKWLKLLCSWSCQAFVYPVFDEKPEQRLVFFSFFCDHLMCSSWLQR